MAQLTLAARNVSNMTGTKNSELMLRYVSFDSNEIFSAMGLFYNNLKACVAFLRIHKIFIKNHLSIFIVNSPLVEEILSIQ